MVATLRLQQHVGGKIRRLDGRGVPLGADALHRMLVDLAKRVTELEEEVIDLKDKVWRLENDRNQKEGWS